MDYWQRIVFEVENHHDDSNNFYFTHPVHCEKRNERESRGAGVLKNYFLGDKFPGVYFTTREAETMYLLTQGHTIKSCSELMQISSRTCEFYLKNMKKKVDVYSRQQLIETILETELLGIFAYKQPEQAVLVC